MVKNPLCNDPRKHEKGLPSGERISDGAFSSAFVSLLETLEYEAAKQAIQLRAELAVSKPAVREELFGWSRTKPTMSQLGALRAAIGDLSTQQQFDSGGAYLTARADREEWFKKSKSLFADEGKAWTILRTTGNVEGNDAGMFGFARPGRNLKADLSLYRYAVSCLFHCAMRAHKRMLERKAAPPTLGGAMATTET